MTIAARAKGSIPIDLGALDRALEGAGIDILISNSSHNVAWLMDGFRSSFFMHMEAIGLSRYLPLFVYQKGNPNSIAYWGQHMESFDKTLGLIWVPRTNFESHGSVDAMERVVSHIQSLGISPRSLGVERNFLPANAEEVLRAGFPDAQIVEAHYALEKLRMIKTPAEIDLLREASERIEASMVATFAQARPGMTKQELIKVLKLNEVQRDLDFDYAFICMDEDTNPNPSLQAFKAGGRAMLDSGGNYRGYIGDIARVGCFGLPDQELQDLLAEVDSIQYAARAVVKAGSRSGDVLEAGFDAVRASSFGAHIHFIAHGMGRVAHERPQIAVKNSHGYPAVDADRLLQPGMVLSIETFVNHPHRGIVGLEDTIVVTADSYEALGDEHRGWNPMGTG
jgi:Xaa-Pro aminopeptidase